MAPLPQATLGVAFLLAFKVNVRYSDGVPSPWAW